MYCAFYGKTGTEFERELEASSFVDDLLRSGVLIEEEADRHKNAIILTQIPKEPTRPCHDFLPFHLLGLPMSTVVDLQRGRMFLMNVVNLGRVVLALEAAGLTVSTASGSGDFSKDPLEVSREVEGPNGERLEIAAVSLDRHFDEMVQELRPLQHLVGVATQMLDAAERTLPDIQRLAGESEH